MSDARSLEFHAVQMGRVAEILAAVARANARIEGMKATNKQRERMGESLGYVEQSFLGVIDAEGIGENQILDRLNR